jgi:peptidoglycan/LPS O-acetylase OafA/YrhL
MFFYTLFALALLLKQNIYWFLGTTLTLLSLASLGREPWWPWPSFYLNTLVLEFFYGMLIARACLHGKRLPPRVALPLMLAAFVLLLTPTPLDALPPFIPEGIPAALIVLSVASLEAVLPRIPKIILFLSEASYAIYLFHLLAAQLPAVIMARYHMNYPWIAVVLSVALSLLVGGAAHQFVERPVTNFFRDVLRVRHQRIIRAV